MYDMVVFASVSTFNTYKAWKEFNAGRSSMQALSSWQARHRDLCIEFQICKHIYTNIEVFASIELSSFQNPWAEKKFDKG
ncbi:hypothetical protein FRX31_014380 [Thalictrum thalictroides]|uniref:Uncharacterized protein n=1 Tax=Thalictrum thalictroides TaxID=46969 RepID=A0A7J6WF03_THATH|nr:hypothetical protein FRX31_014380 [Thalictrum thalictroides]